MSNFLKRIFKTKSKAARSQFEAEYDPAIISIKDWDVDLFVKWLQSLEGVSATTIEKLKQEEWDGRSLMCFSRSDLTSIRVPVSEAIIIEQRLEQLKLDQEFMMRSFNNASMECSSFDNQQQQLSTTSSTDSTSNHHTITRSDSLFRSSVIDSENDIASLMKNSSDSSSVTSILSLPESSFENLNENHLVQTHRPELFNDHTEFTLKVFQLCLRRLEQAFPPLSSRSQSLVETSTTGTNKRASSSNHQVFSSLPPSTTNHAHQSYDGLLLPSQASRLTSLEGLCLNNAIKKVKSCGGLITQEKKLLAHTLVLPDCFMFCYFFNYQTVLMSLEKSSSSVSLSGSGGGGVGVNVGGLLKKGVQQQQHASSEDSHHHQQSSLLEDNAEKRFVSALREITDNTNGLGGFVNNGSTTLTRSFSGLTGSQKVSRSQSFGSSLKPFITIQLVIFPFSNSHVFDMGSDKRLRPYTLFRTGLMVGDWFLEWGEDSIVHPSLSNPYKASPSCSCIQIMKVEGEKNISRFLKKISQICCLWNGTKLYNLQKSNHQHFVVDILSALGSLSNIKQLGSISKFLERIELIGFTDMRLTFTSQFLQNEFPNSEHMTFHNHSELDNFFLKIENINPSYFHEDREGRFDHFLLRLFDRSFYCRKDAGVDEKAVDQPLNRGDCDLCPFNIEGLSLKELEEREVSDIIKTKGANYRAILAGYEPANPASEREWKF